MIHVANRSRQDIPAAKLQAAAEATLAAEKAAHLDLSVAVVTDAEIHLLNRNYLKHDYPTDVISFPLRTGGDPDALLGEVIVSADRARHEARARGLAFEDELCRYVVHGTLHLLGYDDREAERRSIMYARQEEILRSLARKEKRGAPKPKATAAKPGGKAVGTEAIKPAAARPVKVAKPAKTPKATAKAAGAKPKRGGKAGRAAKSNRGRR